mgnify:CR=1 FL=1
MEESTAVDQYEIEKKAQELKTRRLYSQIPERYKEAVLPINPSPYQTWSVIAIRKLLDGWERNLYLWGSPGVGKTYLSCGLVNTAISTNRTAAFREFTALVERAKEAMFSIAQVPDCKIIAHLLPCPIIVIDDLGANRWTEYSKDLASRLIRAIYNESKYGVVFTSNKQPDALGLELSVSDRLYGMCKVIHIEGPSIRRGE